MLERLFTPDHLAYAVALLGVWFLGAAGFALIVGRALHNMPRDFYDD